MNHERMNASNTAAPPPARSAFWISRNGASSTSSERRKTAAPTVLSPENIGSPVITYCERSMETVFGGIILPLPKMFSTPVICCMVNCGAVLERPTGPALEAKTTPALVRSAMRFAKASSMATPLTRYPRRTLFAPRTSGATAT
jgi:hypothetical protein